MHVELDITGSKIRYEAGDHVAIYPTNDSELVEAIGKRLDVDLDTVFSLDNVDGKQFSLSTLLGLILVREALKFQSFYGHIVTEN